MSQYSLGSIVIHGNEKPASQRLKIAWLAQSFTTLFRLSRLTVPVFFALAITLSSGTWAVFTDDTTFPTQAIGAGQWIPSLEIVIDGDKDMVKEAYEDFPCIAFQTDMGTADVFYSWSGNDPLVNGERYSGGCLPSLTEKENFVLRAVAVHGDHARWKSAEKVISIRIPPPEVAPLKQKSERKKDREEENSNEDDSQMKKETTKPSSVGNETPELASPPVEQVEPLPTLEPENESSVVPPFPLETPSVGEFSHESVPIETQADDAPETATEADSQLPSHALDDAKGEPEIEGEASQSEPETP